MDVGIIGSGVVGQALGRGFARKGHTVTLGTRSPERAELQQWAQETGARVGTFAEAAGAGEVVVLATNGHGTLHALELAGTEHFAGKVVIDATNPLDFSNGPPPTLSVAGDSSAGEQIQQALPEARVVKCFNIVSATHMVDPDLPGGPPTMFIAGDDAAAKGAVLEILDAFGWETSDIGGIEASRYLEGLAMVWILHGFRTGTWKHAFKLLGT